MTLIIRPLWIAAAAMLLCACQPSDDTPPEDNNQGQAIAAGQDHAAAFDWWAGKTPAGHTLIEHAGDGRVTNESFVHWNNREYRLQSEIQLDPDGLVTSQTLTGVSPFGAPIKESFSLSDGKASWQTVGESGSVASDAEGFYLPIEWAASASMEALVRAASQRLNGEIALYPSGMARVEAQLSKAVKTPGGSRVLTLYAISGIDFQPAFAWFDEDMQLVVRDLGRLGMLPKGWDREILETLGRLQADRAALLIEQASQQIKTRLQGPVIIEAVDVVDVVAGAILPARHVHIENGIIQAVSESPLALQDALRIDGRGQTLIPGLWDMHSHHGLDDGILNIAGGVTSVRNLGATHERIMEQVEKFDSGEVIGPRTWRGAMIDQVGPYANRNPVTSVDEALQKIDAFAADGYMQVKLYSSIDPQWVPAIAERAHQNGMILSGHVPAFMSAGQAVRAGFDEIQHINMVFLNFLVGDQGDTRQQIRFTTYGSEGGKLDLDSEEVEAFIALLKENKVVVDPTAAIFDEMMRHVAGEVNPTLAAVADHLPAGIRREVYVPSFEIGEERLQDWAATAVRQGEMVRKLHESGVQLVAGTDAMAGFSLHRELELYSEYGISNADVLRIATLGAARVVRADDQLGSVEPGKLADLVLLHGNPLQDISAVRRASWVFKGNEAYRPDELYAAVGVKPFGYSSDTQPLVLSREAHNDRLHGFWLGQSIANWTGLVTEMDRIGGDGPHGRFYTRDDWGQPDQPSIWGEGVPSDLSPTIDWVLQDVEGSWGSDDDTDIEYIYQELLLQHQTSLLTAEQIRDGWMRHIYSDENTPFTNDKGEKENFLWVSNQRAHDLMRTGGLLPPDTSSPANNPEFDMIDAQLTTEIFGLFAPGRPDVALKMAHLPIRTTARENSAWASEFYVVMYSLAASVDPSLSPKAQIQWMAEQARGYLPEQSYSAKMFDFVSSRYQAGIPWEQTRDELYQRYQVEQQDGYDVTSRGLYCNGCFASGINFAASIVSLLYGEGDYRETVKMAVLMGWDSDNPAATWGGLLGFMEGKAGIEQAFGRKFSERFNIHRTRGGFPNGGIDTFPAMAAKGIEVIDRVVIDEMGGYIDPAANAWVIPGALRPGT